MATGRPVETPEANYDEEPRILTPTGAGGHNWQPMAFHPETGLVYIPTRHIWTIYSLDKEFEFDPRDVWNLGLDWDMGKMLPLLSQLPPPSGSLQAWDPVEQEQVWSVAQASPGHGGVLAPWWKTSHSRP